MEKLEKYDKVKMCNTTTDIDILILLSKDTNPQIRLSALKQICPCRVRADIETFWKRVFEMVKDPDDNVRYQVLHTLCDGSPSHMETQVMQAIESFNHDPNKRIKRKAHKVLASYRKTGKWNVL